jgi:hypothetical protein
MSVAAFRLRRALCALIAASPTLWCGPALAVDKAACVAAAEEGQRLRKQGQLVAAREQLVVCASPDCPSVVSQDCTGWLGEVQRSLSSIVVRARDASGNPLHEVAVILDGYPLPETAPTAAIEIDPGEHLVRCERAGFAPSEQRVPLSEGDRGHEIDCEMISLTPQSVPLTEPLPSSVPSPALQPIPAAPEPAGTGIPWGVWPLAGLAVAGFGAFGALEISASSQQHKLLVSCAPYCSPSDVEPVRTKFLLADVSVAVGAVAAGAALLLLLLHPAASGAQPSGASVTRAIGPRQFPPKAQTDVPATHTSLQH